LSDEVFVEWKILIYSRATFHAVCEVVWLEELCESVFGAAYGWIRSIWGGNLRDEKMFCWG
jgi:hypothetical protein